MDRIELIIFDLDGTLVNSLSDLTDATNEFLAATGRPQLHMNDVRSLVGQGARNLVERALQNGTAEEIERCLAMFLAYNEAHIADKTTLYPGVVETLEELGRQDRRLAVVSNKVVLLCRKLLDALGILGHFEVVMGADSTPFRKPSPEPLLKLLRDLDVSPDKAIMVGDSINDIAAGKGACIATVGCTFGYGYEAEISEADFRIDEMKQLLRIPLLTPHK